MGSRKATAKTSDSTEIQGEGNIILDNVFRKIRKEFSDIKINKTSEEHQLDRGVDFQIELVNKAGDQTIDMFKLQVKATDEGVVPLKITENKGYISFQLSHRHIRYYQDEIPWPLLFVLVDIKSELVYWYAIQLDDSLEDRMIESEADNHDSLQVYIDSDNILGPETFMKFVRDAVTSKNMQYHRTIETVSKTLTGVEEFEVDKNLPLLDQLYSLMDYLYEELQYIPIQLLTQHYPFKTSENYRPYYHQFKLYVDNEQLINMFSSFKIKEDGTIQFTDPSFINGVVDYERKAEEILKQLSQNHIYYLISNKTRKQVTISLFAQSTCDCVVCKYHRLDILGAIQAAECTDAISLPEQMKLAYMHYELGNFLKAAEGFQRISILASKQKKKTLRLIAQFNLLRLGRFIKNTYFNQDNVQLATKLLSINLDKEVYTAPKRSHHSNLFSYIKETRFYTDGVFEIQEGTNKLRADYQAFLRGSNFVTHNYDQVLNSYAQLSSFISKNFIIYDRNVEYSLLSQSFTESIFAALALQKTNSHVINKLNSYHLNMLLFDGNHKSTWQYFDKYYLKSVRLDDDHKLSILVLNLLKNHHLVKSAYQTYSPEEGITWRNRYDDLFCNSLCLAAIIEMDNQEVDQVSRAIIACYGAADLPSLDAYEQVNAFFSRKRKQINTDLLKELITFFISFNDFHLQSRLRGLADELKSRKHNLILSSEEEDRMINYAVGRDEQRDFSTLAAFYEISDGTFKAKISESIGEALKIDFDAYDFYYSAITGMLPFKKSEFMEQFLVKSYPDTSKFNFRNDFYGPQVNEFSLLDGLMNLCFKYNLSVEDLSSRNYHGFGEYYDWLINISAFDYSKFNPAWVGIYPTKYYFKEFRKHPTLRSNLEDYLRLNRDPRVERLYFDIYNPPHKND
ncbi:DUF4365 domain-containing protein [Pedobacter sp. GR22-6]|uniref:DUF4365 domain-containing protein n=1 Tax=Pedobacter sp. GR22-6 TaxID=3127957 RepID=UPI00307E7BDC